VAEIGEVEPGDSPVQHTGGVEDLAVSNEVEEVSRHGLNPTFAAAVSRPGQSNDRMASRNAL
jgi:hypothetical protein